MLLSDVADEYEISDKVIAFEVCDLWSVMDKRTGKVLIPAMYGSVYMASEDILQCELERYSKNLPKGDYLLSGMRAEAERKKFLLQRKR